MSSPRTVITDPLPEQATALLWATITDTDGVTPLASADSVLTALTLTLYAEGSETVINSCSGRDILNANGGTVYGALQTDAAGRSYNLLLRLDPADMAMLTTAPLERHVALLTWTWGTPTRTGRHPVFFSVQNLVKVP